VGDRTFRVLRRFCEEIKKGDIIVLRLGTSQVLAIGEVADDQLHWRDDFGDIDGWDLQHVRRVRWLWDGVSAPEVFEPHTLKWGDTVQKMSERAIDAVRKRLSTRLSDDAHRRKLQELPELGRTEPVKTEEVAGYLFDKGMAYAFANALIGRMGELEYLAGWYRRRSEEKKRPVSEHETVAYLVLPLLRALGWTEQKMAVEWDRIDIALFDGAERSDEQLSAVVEAKKLDASCLTAFSQAKEYASGPARQGCRRLIVTDGLRYGVFLRRHGEEFPEKLHAYLNLLRMKEEYPILECRGAKEALWAMSSEWREAPRD